MTESSGLADESRWLRTRAAELLALTAEPSWPEYEATIHQFVSADREKVSMAMRTFGIGHKEWTRWLLLLRAVREAATGDDRFEAVASRLETDARALRRQLKAVEGLPWSALKRLPEEAVPKMLAIRIMAGDPMLAKTVVASPVPGH